LYPVETIRRLFCFVVILFITISAKAQPKAAFTSDINSGCLPLVVHFQDQSTGNPTQWIWNLGNGTLSQLQNPTATYFTPGTYNIKLVVKNTSGADSIVKNQFITVRSNPLPAFSMSDSSGCFPKPIQFTDKTMAVSGNIIQWTWDFGDGNVSTIQNPVHTYTQPGNYSVTLKVINNFGCEKTITRTNVINLGNTAAGFTFINNDPCNAPANVSFSNSSVTATSYKWDFGDGSQSILANPVHLYLTAGTYDVRLVAFNALNCRDTIIKQIVIGSAKADFTYTNPSCAGADIFFQNASTTIPLSAKWIFSDGSIINSINANKSFNAAGNYQVTLISNFGNCSDTTSKTIVIRARPAAAFIESGDLSKCSPVASVHFTSTSAGAVTYNWSFGDGATSSNISPAHNYTSLGTYDVSLTVTNSFGCRDSVTKSQLVKIKPPKINSINGLPYRGCTPYTAHLSADINSAEPVTGWQWDFGDGNTSNASSPIHAYSNPGSYNVRVIITTVGGCRDTLVYPGGIQISNKPNAGFSAAPLVVCAAGPVQFNNTSVGGIDWFWDFGDGGFSTLKDPVHQFGDTGVFTIKLIASSTGCSDTLTIKNYVRNDPPIGRVNIVQNCDNPLQVHFRDSSLGGQVYKWKFGDGDSSSLRYPVHTYNAPGTYRYDFVVYHGSCSYPLSGTITVVDERPKLSISDSVLCRSDLVNFIAGNVNPSNIASYYWDFGNGVNATTSAGTNAYRYTTAGNYQPKLITTDILGCADTITNIITARIYGPTAAFTNVDGTCVGRSIAFNDGSATDGIHNLVEWQWNFGDGTSQAFSSVPATHAYVAAGVYDVVMKVKDTFGCSDSISKPAAVVITDPVAAFQSSDPVKCSANTVQFVNASSGLELNHAWQFGDGATASVADPAHIYNAESVYDVQLIITDKFGCKDTASGRQKIANPRAIFNISDSFSTCPPLLVNVTDNSLNKGSLVWDFGDGSTASNLDPSHYYTTPGKYSLKLHVQGFGNCYDSAVKTIIIKGPTGSFSFDPSTICTNGTISFKASAKDQISFIWDFSDGATLSTVDTIVTHVYDIPGFYQPKLILIDTAGCQVPVITPDTIRVLGVKAHIGLTKNLFCDSVNLQFFDSSIIFNDLPSKYNWDFGDGKSSGVTNPVHTFNQAGLYNIKLTITTQAGCTDSVTIPSAVKIVSSPRIAINNRPAICLNDTISFRGQLLVADTSAVTWNWSLGNGITSTSQNPSLSYSSAGSPSITATAINSSGCSDTQTVSILVHPLPTVKAGTDTMICRGQSYTLQPTGAASYTWRSNPTLSCINCSNPTVSPQSKETYYVKGVSEFGCEANDSVTITVMQPFTMKVSMNDTLCAGDKIQLLANGASKYSWFPAAGLNNSTISNPVASPSGTTKYMVIGSDPLNCFKDTGYVNLSVFPIPEFNIVDNVLTLAAGSTATLKTNGSADITHWKWYPSKDLSCADCPQPVVTAKENITYRAEVWNDGGCASTDKVNISVICNDGNVFIPNTFSPNDDGMNDVFYVRGKGVNSVKSMKIFNRWGELVFEKNQFNANDINAGWNGIYRNTKLTPDVYVYIVDVVCSNNTVFTLKGNVTLIR
jgi:gliding motility-associated-like protein